MDFHVTCGRGTEVFVKEELTDKLKCRVLTVEDGKVFFAVDSIYNSSQLYSLRSIGDLKTVERIFATVTHFPTCQIKGNGKVKFLQLLKDRILDHRKLSKVVRDALDVQKSLTLTLQSGSHSCNKETMTLTSRCVTSGMMLPTMQTKDATQDSCKKGQQSKGCALDAGTAAEPEAECTVNRSTAMRGHTSLKVSPDTQADSSSQPEQLSINSSSAAKRCCPTERTLMMSHDPSPPVGDDGLGAAPQKKQKLIVRSVCDGDVGDRGQLGAEGKVCDGDVGDRGQLGAEGKACDGDVGERGQLGAEGKACDGNADDRGQLGAEGKVCEDWRSLREQSDRQGGESDLKLTFRFSVKCGGWCKKWLQPQRLSKELGIKLTIRTGWTVELTSPDIEICVHINDDFVTVGIPLLRIPLSKRSYILEAGLRSTISWIIAKLADIQPGHRVLDPMCGKATILLEAAQRCKQAAELIGCDLDPDQLHAAARNLTFADLHHTVQLIKANALNLPLSSGTVDRIVCDAPFGHKFKTQSCSLPHFYTALMQEMYRLLVPGGLVVMLTSQDLVSVVLQNVHNIPSATDAAGTVCSQNQTDSLRSIGTLDVTHSTHYKTHLDSLVNKDTLDVTHQDSPVNKDTVGVAHITHHKTHQDSPVSNQTDQAACPTHQSKQTDTHIIHTFSLIEPRTEAQQSQDIELSYASHPLGTSSDVFNPGTKLQPSSKGLQHETDNIKCFRYLSSHYVKLGETHAYIVLLKKPELPPVSSVHEDSKAVR